MTYSFRTNGNFIDFIHTDNTNQAVESVLRSLHNTSRCITWSLPEDTTRISFVVDDIRVDNFLLTEIDFDGVAIDSQDDFETGIIAAFPGLAGGSSPSSSYLVYTALLTQTGTDAPIEVFKSNTIDNSAVWQYGDVGYFFMDTNLDLPTDKVWGASNFNAPPYTIPLIPIIAGGAIVGYYDIGYYNNGGKLSFQIDTYNSLLVQTNISFQISIEIRVYP